MSIERNTLQRLKPLALAACASLLTAACGGGSDEPEPVPPVTAAVPAQAQSSAEVATTYLATLVAVDASATDSLEPIESLPDTLAADDTAEPRAVD
jgi:hypothetical protein